MKRAGFRNGVGLIIIGVLSVFVSASKLESATTTKAKGGDSPALKQFEDRLLANAAEDQLKKVVKSGRYAQLRNRLETVIMARLCCGKLKSLNGLNALLFGYRACEYLPLVGKLKNGEQLSEWLLEHRDVSRLLFRAIADGFDPKKAMSNMRELVDACEKDVLSYPDLAVAFATSHPHRPHIKPPARASMVDCFKWYTRAKVNFCYDLKKMPYELSRHLADSRLTLAERQWAARKYARHARRARTFFDLTYDDDHFRRGKPKKISKLPFTLQNLHKVGGVCIEQAYYAMSICQTFGRPAAMVYGRGIRGYHAWVAALEIRGRRAYWDCKTGRYKYDRYYVGTVWDPVTGRSMLDCELMLVGAAAQLSLRRREEADLSTTLAQMVAAKLKDKPKPDMGALKKLIEDYGKSIDQDWKIEMPECKYELNLALVEKLLNMAIDSNLAHKGVWELIIKLRKDDTLPVDHLSQFFDVLTGKTAKSYPDYSAVMVMRIVPTIDDAAKRMKVYSKAVGIYGRRPDLKGRILIAAGDDCLEKQKDKEKAVKFYMYAATTGIKVPDVALTATAKAESVFRKAKKLDQAIRMYKRLWASTSNTGGQNIAKSQTVYYQFGARLAKLLEETGNEAAAKAVSKKIN